MSTALSSVGVRIRRARQRRGLSQADLAQAVGVTATVLSRVERGEARPTFDLLQTLAERFDVNANWVILGNGPEQLSQLVAAPPPPPVDDDAITERAVRALGAELPPGTTMADLAKRLKVGGDLYRQHGATPPSGAHQPPTPQAAPSQAALDRLADQALGRLIKRVEMKLAMIERVVEQDHPFALRCRQALQEVLASSPVDIDALHRLSDDLSTGPDPNRLNPAVLRALDAGD